MDSNYYKKYFYFERQHWWFTVRAKILSEQTKHCLNGTSEPNILNVGAATGGTTEMLQKYGKVVSVEYDSDCCTFLHEKLGIEAVQASITDLPFADNSFDLVCAFDVLEHVEDDKKAVMELLRVLKPGGMVFVTVPAYMQLWSGHDVVNHHKRRYVKKQLRALFPKYKKPEYVSFFNTLLFPPIYIFRRLANLFPAKNKSSADSDFDVLPGKLTNTILGSIFKTELFLLKFLRFPFGVSIMLRFRK